MLATAAAAIGGQWEWKKRGAECTKARPSAKRALRPVAAPTAFAVARVCVHSRAPLGHQARILWMNTTRLSRNGLAC